MWDGRLLFCFAMKKIGFLNKNWEKIKIYLQAIDYILNKCVNYFYCGMGCDLEASQLLVNKQPLCYCNYNLRETLFWESPGIHGFCHPSDSFPCCGYPGMKILILKA